MTAATDPMIERLEREIREQQGFIEGLVRQAEEKGRDLDEGQLEMVRHAEDTIKSRKAQLEVIASARTTLDEALTRSTEINQAIEASRGRAATATVAYRSAGEYIRDVWSAGTGDKEAKERLEAYLKREAHQKTSDNPGVIPDPIVQPVINFIDAARPLVSFFGTKPVEAPTFHRPKVTGHTAVAIQGTAGSGASANEKTELVSQKMTISRLTGEVNTYGGYVNLSRQNIDFSTPAIFDTVVNDLAGQYAIETEAVAAAAVASAATGTVSYGPASAASDTSIARAIWEAVGDIYAKTKGVGRLFIALSPGALELFGPLFKPVNPQNASSSGLSAGNYGQGVLGTITGIPVLMSAGLGAGTAYVGSTAAVEFYEQRIGTLQAVEPSVLGLQVAYAGYFGALEIESGAVVQLVA